MEATTRVKLFEKNLMEIDIQRGLVLEADDFEDVPEFNNANSYVDLYVMDEEEMVWSFKCFTGYQVGEIEIKPAITGGWRDFVGHHGLKIKDKVIFYVHYNQGGMNNALRFVIHVRRTMRLFGVDITEAD